MNMVRMKKNLNYILQGLLCLGAMLLAMVIMLVVAFAPIFLAGYTGNKWYLLLYAISVLFISYFIGKSSDEAYYPKSPRKLFKNKSRRKRTRSE
jgi:hypothetical protein